MQDLLTVTSIILFLFYIGKSFERNYIRIIKVNYFYCLKICLIFKILHKEKLRYTC